MSEKIIVPTLGESVTEATVSKWLKNQGEKVNSDEPLVELETDKVNIEVPAPSSGVLSQINVKEGQTVNVGTLLGEVSTTANSNKIQVKDEKKYTPPTKKKRAEVKDKESAPMLLNDKSANKIEVKGESAPMLLTDEDIKKKKPEERPLILEDVQKEKQSASQQPAVSPSARKIAAESNINLRDALLKDSFLNILL